MNKKTIDNILKKYEQGIASEEEMLALEQLADKLLTTNEVEVFKSDLEKFEIKKEIRKKIEIKSLNKFNWLKVAASVIVLLGLSVSFWFIQDYSNSPELIVTSTSFGEQKNITLPDGSEVTLNANSSLEYPKTFTQEHREVSLNGEALFHVTKDAKRPFSVESNGLNTTVLGTTFNVSSYQDDAMVQVSLIEGSVRVSEGETKMVLKPGEQSTYHIESSEMTKSVFDSSSVLAWLNRDLILSNTSFTQVQKIVERKYGVKLIFKDAEIASYKVSGTFRDPELKVFLATICTAKSVKYEVNDENEIVLSLN
ncbi:MAG: hypothetical protein CL840_00260 [Crocinitomicaceae bacterium]|nr:hypothetical protein [Crocinitomicaceae bacterium]|tara:strand:- start:16363 stop:17292 length:930 start_codon:yes stop_codon:yes gene_type:complete